jgi:hypothetical protein
MSGSRTGRPADAAPAGVEEIIPFPDLPLTRPAPAGVSVSTTPFIPFSAPPRRSARHPSSSEEGSFLRTPLLIQEGRRLGRRGGYPCRGGYTLWGGCPRWAVFPQRVQLHPLRRRPRSCASASAATIRGTRIITC